LSTWSNIVYRSSGATSFRPAHAKDQIPTGRVSAHRRVEVRTRLRNPKYAVIPAATPVKAAKACNSSEPLAETSTRDHRFSHSQWS